MEHECAAVGCDRVIPRLHLMCPDHWKLVPKPVAAALAEAYRDWRNLDRSNGPDDLRKVVTALRQAQAACVRAVGHVVLKPDQCGVSGCTNAAVCRDPEGFRCCDDHCSHDGDGSESCDYSSGEGD